MSSFELDITIDPQSLQILRAAQMKITLAKPVAGANPNVIWLAFDPFQGNQVQWTEDYGIYASNMQTLPNGVSIQKYSETSFPAQDASTYDFTSNAVFTGPTPGTNVPPGTYAVNNLMPNASYPALTFGLEQAATINGANINPAPINAALVPSQMNAAFTPLTTVYAWLQASFISGTVITEITSKAAKVVFGQVTKIGLTYDPNQGIFVPASGSNGAANNVSIFLPRGLHSSPDKVGA